MVINKLWKGDCIAVDEVANTSLVNELVLV